MEVWKKRETAPDPIIRHIGDFVVADGDLPLSLNPHGPWLPVADHRLGCERFQWILLGQTTTVKDVIVDQDISVGGSTLVKPCHDAMVANVREDAALDTHPLTALQEKSNRANVVELAILDGNGLRIVKLQGSLVAPVVAVLTKA